MEFKLTVLGTGSAKPSTSRFQSAQVLQVRGRFFLIDCGEGVQLQLMRYHLPLVKIDAICLSHIHGDHTFGIFALLSTMGMLGRTAPLEIYAPINFGPIIKFFMSYYGDGLNFEVRHVPLSMKEPELIRDDKNLEIYAFPLNHKIETFGFLFKEKTPARNVSKDAIEKYKFTLTEIGTLKRGEDVVRINDDDSEQIIPLEEVTYVPYVPRTYAYCSDTAYFKNEAEWVRGVDLLYHEATYLSDLQDQAKKRHHSTTKQAATVALEAGVKKLVIGHYSSRCYDQSLYQKECREVFPETYAAADGDVFDIPLIKLG